MAFQVSYEAVEVMRKLAKKIPFTVDALLDANKEVIDCYEQVKDTVGPHSKKIESIVQEVEKRVRKNAVNIEFVANRLDQLAGRCQLILDKKNFKNDLKVKIMPMVPSKQTNNSSSTEAPVTGQREKQMCKQTEYER